MPSHFTEPSDIAEVNDTHGMALIAALILIVIVGMVAAAVLQSTSTEVAISGYHKRAVEGLYAAEAGLAEAQARLWVHPGVETHFLYDTHPGYSAQWTAYLVATPDWAIQDDPTYSPQETHYVPLAGNPANTIVRLNSLQSSLSYWVKVQHKTEIDAEQTGHHTSHPHYVDEDGSLARHRGADKGNILYFGYPDPQSSRPSQFTTLSQTPYLPIERVTAYSVGKGETTRIQVDMVHDPGPPHIAALYSQKAVTLSGEQGVFNGHDDCGASPGLAPIAAPEVALSSPTFQFGGAPSRPQVVTRYLDLQGLVSALHPGAVAVHEDQRNRVWGSASIPVTVLAQSEALPHSEGLVLDHVTGHGILAVSGPVRIEGPVSWFGLIIVTGRLIFDAPGSAITVRGGIWAEEVDGRLGVVDVQYDSCAIKSALLARPVRLMNWKEWY